MALPETLDSLAAAASNGLVDAAGTDAWETVKARFARLFGHADPRQVGVMEGRMEGTREDLQAVSGAELARVRAGHEAAWRARLTLLLEQHPELTEELRALLRRTDRAVAAGP
jgi:hypothetical protein